MDLKALREDAQHWSTGGQSHRAAERMAKCVLLLTCHDPLTLDAAVKVMGRGPDRLTRDEFGERGYWFDDGQWACQVSTSRHLVRAQFPRSCYDNPSICQFACLVAAARMGEKA